MGELKLKKLICIFLSLCFIFLSACSRNSKILSDSEYCRWGEEYILACTLENNPKKFHPSFYYNSNEIPTLIATDMTERLVNLINYYAYDNLNFEDGDNQDKFSPFESNRTYSMKALKTALKEYGFTSKKRLNVNWIMSNPVDSFKLYKDQIDFFCNLHHTIINNKDFDIFGKIYNLSIDEYEEYIKYYCIYTGYYVFKRVVDDGLTTIDNFNNYFFTETSISQSEEYQQMLTIVESYGLSKENQITENWITDYPYEAYHLMKALPDSVREEIFMVNSEE
jgi:hypothetical protein